MIINCLYYLIYKLKLMYRIYYHIMKRQLFSVKIMKSGIVGNHSAVK